MISLTNINKTYKKEIFTDLNLEIDTGDFFIINGVSGSGKSTLLNLIGLLEQYDSGQLEINGHLIDYNDHRLLRNILRYDISYIFQNYALIENKSILYNLKLASKYSKQENYLEVLKIVKLDVDLNTIVGTLSGGEQQRVAIARVIIQNCKIILADEPTGNLDNLNRDLIIEVLKQLNKKGKTIIMVTHDQQLFDIGNKRLNL